MDNDLCPYLLAKGPLSPLKMGPSLAKEGHEEAARHDMRPKTTKKSPANLRNDPLWYNHGVGTTEMKINHRNT